MSRDQGEWDWCVFATGGDEMEITRQEINFLGVLTGLALFGLALIISAHYFPDVWVLRRLLAVSVGEALIVAAILGLTVDRYIKQYLIRKASQDVSKYLVGYNLPDEIKARIQALMGTALIRRNWQIAYTLDPLPLSDEVIIDVRYTFELENVSNTIQYYEQGFQAEKHLNPLMLEMRCDDPANKFRLVAESGKSLGKDQVGVPGVIQALAPKIPIQPAGGKSELRYPFMGHYQLRTPSSSSDTFSFAHPSIGVTITASYPPGYEISIEPSPDMIVTEKMWQMRKKAFLTSEHVMVRWSKV